MTPTEEVKVSERSQAAAKDVYFEEERRLLVILRRCMFKTQREHARKVYDEYFGPAKKRQEEIGRVIDRHCGRGDSAPVQPVDKGLLLEVFKILNGAELNSFSQRVIRMDPEQWMELQAKLIEVVGEEVVAAEMVE